MDNGRRELLARIRAEDFALYEVVLYLDAYPTNKKALAFYEQHRCMLRKLKAEYMQKYGPLTIYDNNSAENWQWIASPWPWEKEAN